MKKTAIEHQCETCGGQGTIDERLGGEWNSNPKAECPDCDGKGYWIAQTDPWSLEDRAAIWFHIPDQFRVGLDAQSAGDVAMAVLRLQVAFCEAIESLDKAEAAPALAQQIKELGNEGRPRVDAALLQRDGPRAEGGGSPGFRQEAVRVAEISSRTGSESVIDRGADSLEVCATQSTPHIRIRHDR